MLCCQLTCLTRVAGSVDLCCFSSSWNHWLKAQKCTHPQDCFRDFLEVLLGKHLFWNCFELLLSHHTHGGRVYGTYLVEQHEHPGSVQRFCTYVWVVPFSWYLSHWNFLLQNKTLNPKKFAAQVPDTANTLSAYQLPSRTVVCPLHLLHWFIYQKLKATSQVNSIRATWNHAMQFTFCWT